MLKKRISIISSLIILSVVIFHFISLKYSLYWNYRWLDIPIHILAGFGVSLFSLWLALNIKHIENINGYKKRALIVMLGSVLLVSILWELFELFSGFTSVKDIAFWPDSISDVLNSILGGVIAFLYFIKYKKAESQVVDKDMTHNFIVIL